MKELKQEFNLEYLNHLDTASFCSIVAQLIRHLNLTVIKHITETVVSGRFPCIDIQYILEQKKEANRK